MLEQSLRFVLLSLVLAFCVGVAQASEAEPAAANPELETRMMKVATELRCLVCQNETIAGSHAELAVDLRQQIREQLASGKSEREILDYMTARYGDFVLYRPPVKSSTVLLWFGPGALLVLALGLLVTVLRRRQKLGDDAFDPEPAHDPEARPARDA